MARRTTHLATAKPPSALALVGSERAAPTEPLTAEQMQRQLSALAAFDGAKQQPAVARVASLSALSAARPAGGGLSIKAKPSDDAAAVAAFDAAPKKTQL